MRKNLQMFMVCWLSAVLLAGGCGQRQPPARYQIVVIPKGATHMHWKGVHAGALKAVADHNAKASEDQKAEIIWQAPGREDARQEQQDIVQRFTSQKVSAIVLAPTDRVTLVAPVLEALKKEIKVVIIDSGLQLSDDITKNKNYLGYVATNNEDGGRKAALHMGKLLKDRPKAKVLMIPYQAGSESTEMREKGFIEEIKKFSNIELIVSTEEAGSTIDTAQKTSELQLALHPNLDGIFMPNESSTAGMLQALRSAGRVKKVQFVGFDSSKTLVDGLKAGEIHGLVLQDPFDMGYQSVRRALLALQGQPVSETLHTNSQVLTPENLNDSALQKLYNPPQAD